MNLKMNGLFLFSFCCLPGLCEEPLRLSLEDHGIRLFLSAAGVGNKCLFSYSDSAGPVPQVKLFLYDLNREDGYFIEDGRIDGMTILPTSDGFLISSFGMFGLKKVSRLDLKGNFVDYVRIEEFTDWPENIFITQLNPADTNQILMSYERPTFDEPNGKEVFIGLIDLESESFQELFMRQKKKPEHRAWWGQTRDRYLFVNVTTGFLSTYDRKSFVEKQVLPAMEPRDSDQMALIRKLGKKQNIPAFLKFKPYITIRSSPNGNQFAFERLLYIRDEPVSECFQFTGESFSKEKSIMTVYTHADKSIFFDAVKKTLDLRRN